MAWDEQHLATPPDDLLLPKGGQVKGRREASKADKILGTSAMPIQPLQQHDHHKWEEKKRSSRRPSFLRAPDIVSRKPNNFVPFPTPSPDETPSPQHLRVRASSPLLGQEYQPQDPLPPSRKPWKKMNQPGSSTTLYSHFNPRDSTADSILQPEPATKDNRPTENSSAAQPPSRGEQSTKSKEQKSPVKESKRKLRPPRIDLSSLFPKPRPTAAPLLSPQRLTNSPSQASLHSEAPSANRKRSDASRLTAQLAPPTSRRPSEQDPSEPSDKENNGWAVNSIERTVRTSEFDLALDKYDELQKRQSRSTDRTIGRKASHSSAGGWSKDMYLSPNLRPSQFSNRVSHSSRSSPGVRRDRSTLDNRPISKKSSKSTLHTSDLTTSSVLCLSSSEDEDEGDEGPAKEAPNAKSRLRDSTATLDDFESEICTASAAQATKGPALKRVDRAISTSNRPHHMHKTPSGRRQPSMSSAGKSSNATRRSHSRRSSGAPTNAGSDTHQGDRPFQQGNQLLSPREINRRSRIMTVTKQEEHLLEAMRQRKGKVTPSLFREPRPNGPDPEQQSMLSVPSRDSYYSADMSFLRLSTGVPPLPTDQSAANSDNAPSPQGASSDAERKTDNSAASPRASLVYSESLPSPTTSGASPMTPTLPIHRFSSLPSNKPPSRPPPAVPQDQRRHSRRRTDSSEAIVLDEADEDKEQEEFPIWAFGLDNGRGLTAVH